MAHCRILFVGTLENLHNIYADCPDSSSESAAEMAFGADYICEYEWDKGDERNTPEFTKADAEYYKDVVEGMWYYCFDIRDRKNYGDYGWVNNVPGMEEEKYPDCWAKEERNRQRVIEALKNLPDNQIFFFADSHW